ncbi:ATP-binding cassette domain-containing protein [Verrucomicrobium sp. BvORR106]|uniref:phosphate ABC transporter ATP-binding protein n=1 Tax=Verrucomicrobium sp. BvORR106 TaxID=1403819 RepID=UPI00056DF510|nr:ATP-binding cassette domain-containing protein [Verrucomicrobium sp. BvORR106]
MDKRPNILQTSQLSVSVPSRTLVRDVTVGITENQVFGLIGPSGAGKSTVLRALNRMTDLVPGLKVTGDVQLHGRSIFAPGTDANALRAKVGMLFQQPVVFPASIVDNVLFGARRLQSLSKSVQAELAESALQEAALWSEVKDRLKAPAAKLSVGQQQRLCLARALATKPEVILMDEPTSALDPRSTEAIEALIKRLKSRHTIVLVTHNLRQARNVGDQLAFIGVRDGVGQLLCEGTVESVLNRTDVAEVDEYVCCQ